MVLGDRNPNRTSLGQRENSLTHTHTRWKAEDSVGCRTRLQMYYAWDEEVSLSLPWPPAPCTHMATPLLPISFSQIEGNPPADLYVLISASERVKACFSLSYLMPKSSRRGLYWYDMDWESISVQKSWRWQEYYSSLDYMLSPATINSWQRRRIYKPRDTHVYTPKLKWKKDFPAEGCILA